MDSFWHSWSLSTITGLSAVLIFTLCTLIAVALYPTPYNPLYQWLSNLVNVYLNPVGAFFFNLGCILTGIILIPFCMGMYKWKPEKTWSKICLIIGMVLGVFASIPLIMVGVFPETHIKQHIIAASGVFGSLFIIIILLSAALFNHPRFIRGVAYFGIVAVLIDLSFKFILSAYKDILAVINPTIPAPGRNGRRYLHHWHGWDF